MNDEKKLPLGEPTLRFEPPTGSPAAPPAHEMWVHRQPDKEEKIVFVSPPAAPTPKAPAAVVSPVPPVAPAALPGMPSPAQQQWGVVISIVIIVLMIIIGAFYAWGQRISQNQVFTTPETTE
jgi:hypothetical protein